MEENKIKFPDSDAIKAPAELEERNSHSVSQASTASKQASSKTKKHI